MKKTTIEVQHFQGCPNSPILIERLKQVLVGLENINYKETIVDSNEKAKEVKFRGSPTLLINGEDFEDLPEPKDPALMCRYYPNGLPGIEIIKTKLSLNEE